MLVLAVSMTLAGCAAKPRDLNPRLAAATAAFGGRFDHMYIPSGGRLSNEAFLAMSRVAGPQKLARDLASFIAPAETEPIRVLVTGPSHEKTLEVVLGALSFYQGRQVPYLELLYLGDPSYETRLAKEVAAVGAVLRFAPYSN